MDTAHPAVAGSALGASTDRRSLFGGMLGMFVDSFDIYVPAFVLPAALGYFMPATLPVSVKATLGTLIFTVTLIGRPLGSLFTGHLGDKYGRRYVAMLSGAGFTLFTFLIGVLPGYATLGYASVALMILFRLLGGMCLSGGYAGPIPLALERSRKEERGLVAGLVSVPAGVAVLLITLINLVLTSALSPQAFTTWGWRLPFLFGTLLGVLYLAYFARVPELEIFTEHAHERSKSSPIKEFFSQGKTIATVFMLTTGFWLASQPILSFTPTLLITVLHVAPPIVSQFEFWINVPALALIILYPVLSQKIGRRVALIAMGTWFLVLALPAYFLMIHLAQSGSVGIGTWILGWIAFALTANPLGVVVLYLAERFPVRLRSTGVAIPYQFGLILPSLYSFWLLFLGRIMPYAYGVLVLIFVGGALLFVASLMSPETKDWEMLRDTLTP